MSASFWIGARLRCASATMRTICASSVSLPTRAARMMKPPVPLTVPPVTRLSLVFSTGIGSPATIANLHAMGRQVLFRAVVAHEARRLRREPQQRFDRRAGSTAGAQLQYLAEQDQSGDHRSSIEVNTHFAAVTAERLRKRVRKKRGGQTVDVSGANTDGDQRKHIQTTVDDGHPTALEERPSSPKYRRSGKNELKPIQQLGRETALNRLSRNELGHRDKHNRHTQHDANPEPSRHIDELGIGFFL